MIRTGHFQLTRFFTVSPAKLWHLLTDAKSRETWGAPSDDMVLEVDVSDLREGGYERHRCGPADAPDFVVDTRWYRLMPEQGATFTETVRVGDDPMGVTLCTYTLATQDGGTHLTVDVSATTYDEGSSSAEFEEGWNSGLDRLVKMAAEAA